MKLFRKKNLLWMMVLLALAVLARRMGAVPALAVAVMLAAALGGLYLWQWATAGRGLARLAALREKHGIEAMVAALRARHGNPDHVRFAVLGDTRNNVPVASEVYRRAASENPALVFHTGDIVRRGGAGEFLRNHAPLLDLVAPAPMFCVPGNHDQGARRDFNAFKALYGADWFSFDFGGCRFTGFNNCARERVGAETLAWLDEELSKPGVAHRYVFMHIPPVYFEETFAGKDRRRGFKKNADAFHALMRKHGVDEVFMAHIHGYATAVLDGVRYTLTAGGGAPLSRHLTPGNSVHNYVVLDVSMEGVRRSVARRGGDGAWASQEEG